MSYEKRGYAWIVTEDLLDDNLKGVRGPALTSTCRPADYNKGNYRLLDDDDSVLCYVCLVGDYSGFEPLDDWGTAALGATSIQYFDDDLWFDV